VHPLIDFAFIWFLWAVTAAPMMWRLHVRLPRARRRVEAERDSARKERDLRRIDLQLSHAWASRKSLIAFVTLSSVLLVCTVTLIVLKAFALG